ncbi:MAG: hypothetical protein O3B01_15150 [Planctomycetota bacterium]|nr:hypothetical protein [Planctomycetota bacterium]
MNKNLIHPLPIFAPLSCGRVDYMSLTGIRDSLDAAAGLTEGRFEAN